MFSQLHTGDRIQHMLSLCISLGLHLAFLGWCLYRPAARFLAPSSVAFGRNGSAITELYWPSNGSGQAASVASHPKKSQTGRHQPSAGPLRWRQPSNDAAANARLLSKAEAEPGMGESPVSNQGRSAGSPFGMLFAASANGDEVRPALPVVYPDPGVRAADLQGIAEGDVIVEITIDESGTIVQKAMIRSMGPVIDAKVLAALENWRFRPATRNGAAIPSKQDVCYHFRPS